LKYFIEDPNDYERTIEIPSKTKQKIVSDYLLKTHYWTVGFMFFIVGFLLGVTV